MSNTPNQVDLMQLVDYVTFHLSRESIIQLKETPWVVGHARGGVGGSTHFTPFSSKYDPQMEKMAIINQIVSPLILDRG